LSSQTDQARGIGAATDWVFGQMQAIAATSNGAMTVQRRSSSSRRRGSRSPP